MCQIFLTIMYGPMVLTQDTLQQHVAGKNLLCTHGMCHKASAADPCMYICLCPCCMLLDGVGGWGWYCEQNLINRSLL